MKKFISIDIPTKKYIKAYIIHQLGPEPVISQTHWIGNKMYDLLEHKTNERFAEYTNTRYACILRVYINRHIFHTRGANLNETNLRNFNFFIEKKIKQRFYELMDDRIELLPNFLANLPDVRRQLGIDIDDWEDDSMKKDYYRYRKANGKPTLYKNISSRSVPCGKFVRMGF